MSRLILWECDHCRQQHASPELPDGWAQAYVTGKWALTPQEMQLLYTKGYIWCKACWKGIGQLKNYSPEKRP